MREVLPGVIWLGNAADARDVSRLVDLGIEAVVDLAAEEAPPELTRDLVYCRFPLLDGAGNSPDRLCAAVETVVSLLAKRVRTLVSCGAGMSRSPCIAAMALAIHHGKPPDDTLRHLLSGQPQDVSATLWADVNSACGHLR